MPTDDKTLAKKRLRSDASNRAKRSLLVGLVIDLAVAVVLGLSVALQDANGWGDLEWKVVGFSIAKTVVQTIGSYLLRRVVDPSVFPTPLPPEDPGPPADEVEPVPPNTAVEDNEVKDADAEAEVEVKPAPKKRPTKKVPPVTPDDETRRIQAEIDLAQAKAATPTRPERVAKKVAERKKKGTK